MNKILSSIYLALLFMVSGMVSAQTDISLQQAMEQAVKNRTEVKNAQVKALIAQNQTDIASAKYLPTVNANIDGRRNIALQTNQLPGELTGKPPGTFTPVKFGTNWSLVAAIDVNQPILDMSYFPGVDYARVNQLMQEKNTEKIILDIKVSVTQAYYGVLLNEARYELSKKNNERDKLYYEDAKTKYENGIILKTDLDKLYLDYLNSSNLVVQNENNLITSKQYLAIQMGLPPDTAFTLTDKLENNTDLPSSKIQDTSFYQNRAEYDIEELQMQMYLLSIKRIRKEYYPKISAYGYAAGQNYFVNGNPWYPISYAGLKLTMPIFDGMQRKNNVDELKLQMQSSENNLVNLKNNMQYEVQNTYNILVTNSNNLQFWKKNMELAEEVVKVNQQRFKESRITTADLNSSESTFKQTQTNYLNALYDYLVAKINWEKAAGILK